jgi:hypothetical protein
MELGNLGVLQACKDYKSWHDCARGGILYISAVNHPDAESTSPLWLSLAIAELASSKRQRNSKVIFYVVEGIRDTPHRMMSSIICEILEWDRTFFAKHNHLVQIESKDEVSLAGYSFRLATELWSRWSKSHPNEHIYLVIDRVDKWLRDDSELVDGQWREAMETIFEWASNSKVLKVCMLAEQNHWGTEVSDIMRLICTRRRLREVYWNTECLRQGDRFDDEVSQCE